MIVVQRPGSRRLGDGQRWADLLPELYGTSPDRLWVVIDSPSKRCYDIFNGLVKQLLYLPNILIREFT